MIEHATPVLAVDDTLPAPVTNYASTSHAEAYAAPNEANEDNDESDREGEASAANDDCNSGDEATDSETADADCENLLDHVRSEEWTVAP